MKKFILISILLLNFSTTNPAYAACSGEDCCTVTAGVVTFPDSDSCAIEPDSYSITMFKMYLCTSEPSAPTSSAATGYTAAGCVLTFEATSGSAVTITPGGNAQAFPGATFNRPGNATYTHGVMLIDNVFTIKLDREFNKSLTGGSSGTGKFCATKAGGADETDGESTVCSATDNLTAGAWAAELTSFQGIGSFVTSVTASNLNGTGASISGHLVDTDEQIAGSRGAVANLIGIQTFAAPVVITKDFSGLDIAFGVNQGATCWDDGGSDVIECGSGPFQAVITALSY